MRQYLWGHWLRVFHTPGFSRWGIRRNNRLCLDLGELTISVGWVEHV